MLSCRAAAVPKKRTPKTIGQHWYKFQSTRRLSLRQLELPCIYDAVSNARKEVIIKYVSSATSGYPVKINLSPELCRS